MAANTHENPVTSTRPSNNAMDLRWRSRPEEERNSLSDEFFHRPAALFHRVSTVPLALRQRECLTASFAKQVLAAAAKGSKRFPISAGPLDANLLCPSSPGQPKSDTSLTRTLISIASDQLANTLLSCDFDGHDGSDRVAMPLGTFQIERNRSR